ncbi:hypothetical protein [Crocinitomix catalasitica]|uniref:hypothetical protein n=1 Tax=Crocinitomix catalasitica TaxID=184607 RepID=UPI0009077D81|nr:hypothetical protein [Crocinitomix catalasitica]
MAKSKKFGTFTGVFTPSILTILGVIMYLRMGWVVGNAGLLSTIIIILIAHVISITTGLSISSIATDKKVGAGGVYYVLSRSLGLPIGGALGLTLFAAMALSIALYMVGFAEIFNQWIGFGYETVNGVKTPIEGALTNSYRITGSLGLLTLTILALISTSIALKTQFIILALILVSLFSIFLGSSDNLITTVASPISETVGFFAIFAIFFPAVTGFTAGVSMSGDLKDPKKSIPFGTMLSIGTGLIIYIVLAIFISLSIDEDILINNPNALFQFAAVNILVFIGVWGATLSSALGGILGGPRILQAMSVDRITPKTFAEGVGQANEPRKALILTVIIAEAGVLIGDLNVIAEIVTMFYLAAYGFINLSFFLESWASSDFKPTFKVKKWVGLLGFISTFIVMSQLNLLAMIAAFVIIGGIYFYLSRKQVALGTGDIWQSVWATIVRKGLKRMEAKDDHKRNWTPNILMFSADSIHRSKMIEFSKAIAGQNGIVTNFDLHENPEAKVLFPKNKESVSDEELDKHGIFGRKIEVQNVFKSVESIACTFGFSGIEPNTVLMNWPGQTKDPIWFTNMTEKLIQLDHNVLYLDYDERWGFGKKEKIDLWWRGAENNAELMLVLAKFITSSPNWSRANIRVLTVNNADADVKIIEKKIHSVLEEFRVKATVKVLKNDIDQKPFYELMKIHSHDADLIFVGIPEIKSENRADFVERTNNLVSVIGTTLLVKASTKFDETDLKIEHINLDFEPKATTLIQSKPLILGEDELWNAGISALDNQFEETVNKLITNSVQEIKNYQENLFARVSDKTHSFLNNAFETKSQAEIYKLLSKTLHQIQDIYSDALEHELPEVYDRFDVSVAEFLEQKEKTISYLQTKLQVSKVIDKNGNLINTKRKIAFRNSIQRLWFGKILEINYNELVLFGYENLLLLHKSRALLNEVIWKLLDSIEEKGLDNLNQLECQTQLKDNLDEIVNSANRLVNSFYTGVRNKEIDEFNKLSNIIQFKDYKQRLEHQYTELSHKQFQKLSKGIRSFPSYFYRNLILFTYQLKADFFLIDFSTNIQKYSDEFRNSINENYLIQISNNFDQLVTGLANVESALKSGVKEEISIIKLPLADEFFFNAEKAVKDFTQKVLSEVNYLPEEIELMTAKSINSIKNEQGKEIETEKIALRDIAEYMVRSDYLDPMYEQIQNFYDQLKRNIGKIINSTLVLQEEIDNAVQATTTDKLQETFEFIDKEIREINISHDLTVESFLVQFEEQKNRLIDELEINNIIEQEERLHEFAKKHKKRKGVGLSLKKANNKLGEKISLIFDYFARKQHDLTAIEYKRSYRDLISEQGLLANFYRKIEAKEDLPFFYKQLYLGTHFSDSATISNRQSELERINAAIESIDSGKPGGIMILGSARSGKSFLTSHIANHILKSKVLQIQPPINNSGRKKDLYYAIQRVAGVKEGNRQVFDKIPKGTVFIFEDIEQWWRKTKGGDEILNELSEIIAEYGSEFYFLLNANIHAYSIFSENTTIQNALAQTVILAPLTVTQLRDAIWSRHLTSGFQLQINEVESRYMSQSKIQKYLNKYHTTSSGVVGVALQQWITAINDKEENTILINNPVLNELPLIDKPEWQNLIYQLFIHHNIKTTDLYKLYGAHDKLWIDQILMAMKSSGICKQNERGGYLLKKEIKPYIENWLIELGYFK